MRIEAIKLVFSVFLVPTQRWTFSWVVHAFLAQSIEIETWVRAVAGMFSGAVGGVTGPTTGRNIHACVWWTAFLLDKQLHEVERWRICNFLVVAARVVICRVAIRFRWSDWNRVHRQHCLDFIRVHRRLTAVGRHFWHVQLIVHLCLLCLQNRLQVRHARALSNSGTAVMVCASRYRVIVLVIVVIAGWVSKTIRFITGTFFKYYKRRDTEIFWYQLKKVWGDWLGEQKQSFLRFVLFDLTFSNENSTKWE